MNVTLITGRTIKQGMVIEHKDSTMYTDANAICEFDPDDMKKLKVSEGDTVEVSSEAGAVFVRAVKSLQSPHKNIIFIPMGPWANQITSPKTDSVGMPSFKGIPASVKLAKDKKVLTYPELLKQSFGK
ncbi:molybdopterin dinucleotide binding domain protein [archaeon BMS3Abin16]|nr:molybdopterin dinucleotide binding domain protein [archaeon BMS3Abin16]HDY73913.1 molybdopterin dinucleotide-binding protein [Euryarchaeota archaeon]